MYKKGISDWLRQLAPKTTALSFARNYFIFLKNFFQFKNLLQMIDLKHERLSCPYSYFS